MNPAEIIELIQQGKPLVKAVFDSLEQYEEEWNKVSDFVVKNVVKSRSAIYKGFIEEGLPPEVALSLTVVSIQDMKELGKQMSNQQKEKK